MRISKDFYYLDIAKAVAQRSTCLRRNFGVVLVKNDQIISTGYNGPPRNHPHCEICVREQLNIKSGENYELCEAVHAELNAVVNAARVGVSIMQATLYIYGQDGITKKEFSKAINPCKMCARIIKNAGIITVLSKISDTEVKEWDFVATYQEKQND